MVLDLMTVEKKFEKVNLKGSHTTRQVKNHNLKTKTKTNHNSLF